MKILFIYSTTIEIANGEYHHNFIEDIISRYKIYGELTVCTCAKYVNSSKMKKINDRTDTIFTFIKKENNIINKINRTYNINIINKLIQNNDFIITHVPCSVSDLIQKYAKKYNKSYLGVVIGCPWDSLWNHSWKGKLLAFYERHKMKDFMKHVPYAIYVTQSFLQQRYPCKGESIGCSDVSLIKKSRNGRDSDNRKAHIMQFTQNHINICTIGAIDNLVKGHKDVINAISKLKDSNITCYYHLIGGGKRDRIEKLAQKKGVNHQIIFHGLQNHDQVFEILNEIDIYIQPSRTEGLCRSLVEAMSQGCPTIATNVGGNPELVDKGFLYTPEDTTQLTMLIRNLNSIEAQLLASETNLKKSFNYDHKILENKRTNFIAKALIEYNTYIK